MPLNCNKRALLVLYCLLSFATALEELVQWNQVEYDSLPENLPFIQYNNVPQGFAPYKDKIFIAVPRRNHGIPSTLNYVKLDGNNSLINPKLYSYPSYEMNELDPQGEANSNRIVSVYRPRVDECDRLWLVDSGIINTSGNATIIQRPSIIVIDLNTDKVLKRYEIPSHVVRDGLGLASITIDVINCLNSTYAYIPDLMYSKILIYNFERNAAYSMSHNFFHMNPHEGEFDIDNLKFSWDDGIFSIALSPLDANGHRTAYFHPMSSFSEFSISTKILRNETLATRFYHENDVKLVGSRGKDSQSTMHSLHHDSSVMYFAQINKNAVWCWNTKRPLRPSNVHEVFRDDIKLVYPSDLVVYNNDLWVMSNRMIRHIYKTFDADDFNFRIFRQSIKDKTCSKSTKSKSSSPRSQRRRFRN